MGSPRLWKFYLQKCHVIRRVAHDAFGEITRCSNPLVSSDYLSFTPLPSTVAVNVCHVGRHHIPHCTHTFCPSIRNLRRNNRWRANSRSAPDRFRVPIHRYRIRRRDASNQSSRSRMSHADTFWTLLVTRLLLIKKYNIKKKKNIVKIFWPLRAMFEVNHVNNDTLITNKTDGTAFSNISQCYGIYYTLGIALL